MTRHDIPETLTYYQDAGGTFHYKISALDGCTLLQGSTPYYAAMLAACPTLMPIRITKERSCRKVPTLALWSRLLVRANSYDLQVAMSKAMRWELAIFEIFAWSCVAMLTYIAL